MRKFEGSGGGEVASRIKLSLVLGAGAVLAGSVLMLITAIMVANGVLSYGAGEWGSGVVIIICTFISGIISVKMQSGKTLVSGLSVSATVLLLLWILGIAVFGGNREASIMALVGIPAAGIVAGLIGGKRRKIR